MFSQGRSAEADKTKERMAGKATGGVQQAVKNGISAKIAQIKVRYF